MTQPAPLALDYSDTAALPGGRAPWFRFLIVNGSVPLAILAVYLLGLLVESDDFNAYYRRILMLIGFNVILAVGLQMINGFSGQFSLGHAGFMAVGAYLAAYPAKLYAGLPGAAGRPLVLENPAATLVFYLALFLSVGLVGGVLYALFSAVRATRRFHAALPSLLVMLLLAWMITDVILAQRGNTSILLVWSRGIDLVGRMYAAIITSGAEPAATISGALPQALRKPLTFLVLLLGAGACAGIVGLIVGLPTLRLRGDYLAIATLGLSEIIRIIIQNSPPLGGALGLTNIPRYTNFAWLWGVAILSIVLVWRLAYSARGRQIIATREDEIAASAVGIGTTRQKVLAFVVGAFLGGVAGALFAMQERSITPGYFNIQKSIEIVVIVTLGGLGSISGAILAAIVLTLLPELLRTSPSAWPIGFAIVAALWAVDLGIRNREFLPSAARGLLGRFAPAHPAPGARVKWMSNPALWAIGVLLLWQLMRWTGERYGFAMSDFRMIIYSLLLVFMMLVRPQGLLGGRELWPRRKPAPLRGRDRQPGGHGFEATAPIDRPPTLDKPATQSRGDTKEREGLS